MTKARKGEPKADKKLKPRVHKETVKDLDPRRAEDVRGGAGNHTKYCQGGGDAQTAGT